MSTRCNIIIKDGTRRLYLYHHHDGYPEGVGTELLEYLKPLAGHSYSWSGTCIANALVKGRLDYPLSSTGEKDEEYSPTYGLHGDIEYCYVINCRARTLRCYEIAWEDEIHENYEIRFDRVFKRKYLKHIPDREEREVIVRRWMKARAV